MPEMVGADLLDQGAQLVGVRAVVTYTRGPDSVSFTATLGRTLLRLDDIDGGTRIIWTDQSILFRGSVLILGGVLTVPRRGDRVLIPLGDLDVLHEVMAPGDEPEWRWRDANRTQIRCHLKRVG
jgi:hypothetical protein